MTRLLAIGLAGGLATPPLAAPAEACGGNRPAPTGVRHRTVTYALTGEPNLLNPPLSRLNRDSRVALTFLAPRAAALALGPADPRCLPPAAPR